MNTLNPIIIAITLITCMHTPTECMWGLWNYFSTDSNGQPSHTSVQTTPSSTSVIAPSTPPLHAAFLVTPIAKKKKNQSNGLNAKPEESNSIFTADYVSNSSNMFNIAPSSTNDELFWEIKQDREQFSLGLFTIPECGSDDIKIPVPCSRQNLFCNAASNMLIMRHSPPYENDTITGSKVLLYNTATKKAVNIDASNNGSVSWHPTENIFSISQLYDKHSQTGRISIGKAKDDLTTQEMCHVETCGGYHVLTLLSWIPSLKAFTTPTEEQWGKSKLKTYDYESGNLLSSWSEPAENVISDLTSNNQNSVIAASSGVVGPVYLIDAQNGKTVETISYPTCANIRFKGWYNNYLACLNGANNSVDVYDQRSMEQPVITKKCSNKIAAAQLSPDGTQLAVLDDAGTLENIMVSSKCSAQQKVLGKLFLNLAWSAHNKYIIVQALDTDDGIVQANYACTVDEPKNTVINY